jgi:hypothetical protein
MEKDDQSIRDKTIKDFGHNLTNLAHLKRISIGLI